MDELSEMPRVLERNFLQKQNQAKQTLLTDYYSLEQLQFFSIILFANLLAV